MKIAVVLPLLFLTTACGRSDIVQKKDVLGNQAPLIEPTAPTSDDAIPQSQLRGPSCPSFEVELPETLLSQDNRYEVIVEGRRFSNRPATVVVVPESSRLRIGVESCDSLMTDRYAPVKISVFPAEGETMTLTADFNTNTYRIDDKPSAIALPRVLFQNR